MHSRASVVWTAAAVALALPAAADQARNDGGWELKGPTVNVERHGGRDVIAVENGTAFRRDVKLQDGTIEFDVQLTRRRSFVYVMFRMAGDREMEEVYLRPHKSALPDAVQYAPVFQGSSAWQLFHGPGATAAVAFEPGVFTPVRLELRGEQAALFVGDLGRPALVVPRLARPPAAGYVALRGFAPPGSGTGPVARFANVRITPGTTAFDFTRVPTRDAAAPGGPDVPEPNAVRAWALSRAFAVPEDTSALPPDDVLGAFSRVEAEPSGRVVLHRHVALPAPDTREVAAVARLRVRAAAAGVRRLDLGFSDAATVFLNGRPVFRSDARYSYDDPRQEGLVHYGQASVFLPLEPGWNDLSVLVSDGFGGWGLMGRFPDAVGLEFDAR